MKKSAFAFDTLTIRTCLVSLMLERERHDITGGTAFCQVQHPDRLPIQPPKRRLDFLCAN